MSKLGQRLIRAAKEARRMIKTSRFNVADYLDDNSEAARFYRDELLEEFVQYCREHPTERFWQALRNWSGHNFILAASQLGEDGLPPPHCEDTFYWYGTHNYFHKDSKDG